LETAAPSCAHWKLEPHVLSGLAEMDFGTWDGLLYDEIRASDPDRQQEWLQDPTETAPPDGETLGAFRTRIAEAWQRILQAEGDEPIAVFAHGGTLRAIISSVLELGHRQSNQLQVDPGSISRLTVYADGVTVVTTLNDTCHLRCAD
jgi:broad specificity phosphatase PhoE